MTDNQNGHQFHEVVDENNRPVPQSADVEQTAQQRANQQADAQEQANQSQEMEFSNRVDPVVDELTQRIRDLANEGDEAGVAHTRFALDVVVQRFRVAGGAGAGEGAGAATTPPPPQGEEPPTAEGENEPVQHPETDAQAADQQLGADQQESPPADRPEQQQAEGQTQQVDDQGEPQE